MTGGSQTELDRMEIQRSNALKIDLPSEMAVSRDVYGNRSKNAKNWICGPTHEFRRQHIPGYTGRCRGYVNKDFMPKSFAKVTAELFAQKHPMNEATDSASRFQAT